MTRPRLSAMQRLDLAVMGYADAVTWCEQHPNEGDASLAWSRYRRAVRALLVERADAVQAIMQVRFQWPAESVAAQEVRAAMLKGKP